VKIIRGGRPHRKNRRGDDGSQGSSATGSEHSQPGEEGNDGGENRNRRPSGDHEGAAETSGSQERAGGRARSEGGRTPSGGRNRGDQERPTRSTPGGGRVARDVERPTRSTPGGGRVARDVERSGGPRRRDDGASRGPRDGRRPIGRRDADGASRGGQRDTRPGAGIDGRGQWRKKRLTPEEVERKKEARHLAKERGIPLVQAHQILQGETTLNEVLKGMRDKSRFDRLVKTEGMEPSLAGQVVAGKLDIDQARLTSEIRKHRQHAIDYDAIKVASLEKKTVAIQHFELGWRVGKVTAVRTYDFDLLIEGEVEALHKHDLKLLTKADVATVEPLLSVDERVQKKGLASSRERGDRVRPDQEGLLKILKKKKEITLTLRDGTAVTGLLVGIGRWDLAVQLADGETVVDVFLHALHSKGTWALKG
jgi:hypothetical protein